MKRRIGWGIAVAVTLVALAFWTLVLIACGIAVHDTVAGF